MQNCDSINFKKIVPREYILNKYTIIEEIGQGSDGVILKVLDNEKNKILALKSIAIYASASFLENQYIEVLNEIKLSCLLTETKKYTHSIGIPLEFAIVDKKVYLDEDGEDNLGLVIIMPLFGNNLSYIYEELDIKDKKSILFELMIAVIVMHKMGVAHGDIHDENILMSNVEEIRSYNINGSEYIVRSKYFPVIIDFGLATSIDSKQNKSSLDWDKLSRYFEDIFKNEMWKRSILDPMFNFLKEEKIQAGELVRVFEQLDV